MVVQFIKQTGEASNKVEATTYDDFARAVRGFCYDFSGKRDAETIQHIGGDVWLVTWANGTFYAFKAYWENTLGDPCGKPFADYLLIHN